MSFGVAWQVARVMDSTWRLLRVASPPPLSRQMLRMIGRPFTVSIERARHDLGFGPVMDRDEALEEFHPYRTLAA